MPENDSKANNHAGAVKDSLEIKELIAKGNKYTSSHNDSLPTIAWQLESISRFRNNGEGLVYAGIFKAKYYWMATNYTAAMKVALQSLTDAEKWNVRGPVPDLYAIMANIHKENGNYPAAFQDCIKGLKEARINHDTTNIISLMGLNAMFTHGYYRKNGNYKNDHTSLQLELDALKIAESSPKYEQMRIRFYDNIAQTYKENKEYSKALLYANQAVALANKYHQPRSLTYAYNWLGESYYYMGQHDKGIDYLKQAIAVSRQLKQPYREMEIYEAMHWCYLSSKDYEPAIECLRRSFTMRDSLQIAMNEKQVSEMQLKYNSGGKDKQIALLGQVSQLKSQKILRISVAMVCFVILMFVILYQYYTIHRYSRKVEKSNQELNAAMLKIAHIQSHQIRKPLASILGLMNIIKGNNYVADKEVLQKMDEVANDLDERIRDVIKATEVGS
ncbi:tetratricopeptide repeat protein [Mucilaginibacter boryungensis]|uniref:histidine kinase n=1 Tax=Mucilaginibacter boryungensis TaxID=768480 RepID=A0ABR9XI03_9SPHI|nr:tetratricopeptide repeat protein [Mucilaginibacter boryungensis]MBE9666886.1 tetratricopeptide repeat-containing sensor histidine kinase [Mucilaginibacter boryungensis]